MFERSWDGNPYKTSRLRPKQTNSHDRQRRCDKVPDDLVPTPAWRTSRLHLRRFQIEYVMFVQAQPSNNTLFEVLWHLVLATSFLVRRISRTTKMQINSSVLLMLIKMIVLPTTEALRDTAIHIESLSCKRNIVTLAEASCGLLSSDEPCILGSTIDFAGSYRVKRTIPTEVVLCGKVEKSGTRQRPTCQTVDLCQFMQW